MGDDVTASHMRIDTGFRKASQRAACDSRTQVSVVRRPRRGGGQTGLDRLGNGERMQHRSAIQC